MKTELILTENPIVEIDLLKSRRFDSKSGAVIYFSGVVRDLEAGERITGLHYETFREMASHQFELLFQRAGSQWPIASIRLVHRLGFVKTGETSLWVEVAAGHRGEAFAAAQYIIDEMKKVVPIWKKAVFES
ncbi:MAG: molybdopterin synthase catalytic subunit [Verrucomicrobiales bacterium]|nr:molybdopterin synthase catalytic subunit [Verrucomicrobiales bacterium]